MNFSFNLIFFLVFFCFSCKPTIIAQEKKHKISKPKYGDLVSKQAIAPNIIKLRAIILKKIESINICNTEYFNALEVKVVQILDSGSSITNMITKDQELIFANSQLSVTEITSDKIINLTVREGLCQEMNQSLYEIIDF